MSLRADVQGGGVAATEPLLEARELVKVYPPSLRALDGFSIALRGGEIHGLAGANGAGKSTAIKILTGVEQPSSGAIAMAGHGVVVLDAPADATRLGIGVVHQELPLLPNLTAAENVVLGLTGRGPLSRARRREAREIYREAARPFPSAPSPDARVEQIGLYAWQVVAIVRALHCGAKVLVLDEPTSSLNTDERAALHANLRDLTARSGIAVLYVTHFLDDVLAVSDTITVVRDGRLVACEPAASLDEAALLRHMLGQDAERVVNAAPAARERAARPQGDPDDGLRIRDVRLPGAGPLDLDVARGERVGLYGLEGSGAHELLEALFGLRPHRGTVEWRGRKLGRSTRERIDAGIGLVSGDRRRTLIRDWTVAMNHALPWLSSRGPFRTLDTRRDRAEADATIAKLAVKGGAEQPMRALSGGNQQKVALGRWLTRDAICLMADEPTHGVDAHGRMAIHDLLREMTARENALIVHSTDPEELVALCDRVVVMVEGRVTDELAGDRLTVEALEASARSKRRQPIAA
jgi:ribose transport system ATP-binding protein